MPGFLSCTDKNKFAPNPSDVKAGLIHTIIDSLDTGGVRMYQETWIFNYDDLGRLLTFIDSVHRYSYTPSTSSYHFTYDNNNPFPNGYRFSYIDSYGATGNELHIVQNNSAGQMVLDSLVSYENSNRFGNTYYNYSEMLVTKAAGYYQVGETNLHLFQLDSIFLDARGNAQSAMTYFNYNMPGLSDLHFIWGSHTDYGTVPSPYYNTAASIMYVLRGGYPGPTLPTKYDFYSLQKDTMHEVHDYRNETNSEGKVIRINDLSTGHFSTFTYY